MGRPPTNGVPAFRFTQSEVAEMEAILQQHQALMPSREILEGLAEKFTESSDRRGKVIVQFKQIWNWFQNRRYALRARASRTPGKLNVSSMPRDDHTNQMRSVLQPIPSLPTTHLPANIPASLPAPSVPGVVRSGSENTYLEFEAKSTRDGAWYDVQTFLAHRNLEIGDPEVQVRLAGFGPEEDEWVNVKKHVRQRSLPCEASECVAVIPGDLILCFQEGKDQALYFDAIVLDAQRRRHDVRGCRCRFLVRYSHDQSEEIVPLRKICRRPETDYRLLQLHASSDSSQRDQQKKPIAVAPPAINPSRATSAEIVTTQESFDTGIKPGNSNANAASVGTNNQSAVTELKNSGINP